MSTATVAIAPEPIWRRAENWPDPKWSGIGKGGYPGAFLDPSGRQVLQPGSPAFPTPTARDMITGLKLIDGEAVWGDQRRFSFLPAVPCTIGSQTA